jgi:hypothetical protein
MKTFAIIAVVLLVILLAPFATIWALNTLFPALAIPYGFDTWVAVVLLSSGVMGVKKS